MGSKNKVVFAYRVRVDDGKAPCIDDGMLSLACCKRKLRRIIANEQQRRDDVEFYLLGICTGKAKHNILFCAKLDAPMLATDFYSKYLDRKDSLYTLKDGVLERNTRHPCVHSTQEDYAADVGDPETQWVLLSHEFKYFGISPLPINEDYTFLSDEFLPARQGHRPKKPYAAREGHEKLHEYIMEKIGSFDSSYQPDSQMPFPPPEKC